MAAYIAMFVATVPAGRRGGANTLVGVNGLGRRLWRLGEMAWNLSLGARAQDTTRDAWALGGRAIRESSGGVGWVAIGCAMGLGVWWVVVLRREAAERADGEAGGRAAQTCRVALALFGLGVAIASVLPIALVATQPMQARYLYGAGAGVAIALAAGMDVMLGWAGRGRRGMLLVGVLAGIAAGVAMCGAVCCVGWQTQFRQRSRADVDQMDQLRRLVPDPPRGAVFVPLELGEGRASRLRAHNPGVLGALAFPWSCWAYVQRGYGRSDVTATHGRPGPRVPVSADGAGIRYARGVCDAWGVADPARTLVPWETAIVFVVDDRGVVRLVSREEAMRRIGGGATPGG